MEEFARAFQARKKSLLIDAIAFCASAVILNATHWILPLALSGFILAFKLTMLWINRKKYSGER